MPEELLLLLEKVEKEGAGATISCVSLTPRPCFNTSYPVARPQSTWPTTGHHRELRCNRSTSKRSSNNNTFTVHTNRLDSFSLDYPRVTTNFISPRQTQPPRRSRHTAQWICHRGRGREGIFPSAQESGRRRELDMGSNNAHNHYGSVV